MLEIKGNIWDYHNGANWVVVPTNGFVRKDGTCVMGRGVAAQCASKFPAIPGMLGTSIKNSGNKVYCYGSPYRIFSFPVKHNWWEEAEPKLISKSVEELLFWVKEWGLDTVYLPQVGCGNGQLAWVDVRPLLIKKLDDRFTVVEYSR